MSYTAIWIHIVFSTNERRPYLADRAIRANVHAYMGGIVRNLRGTPLAINGIADHVHLLLRLPSSLSVADAVRVIKTNSSKWIRERWPRMRRFSWQTKFSAFAVSPSALPKVVRYIEAQESHHATHGFGSELESLLKKNGVDYDARYLWR
jgi:REP element-mobilizing transposase RayT